MGKKQIDFTEIKLPYSSKTTEKRSRVFLIITTVLTEKLASDNTFKK